MIKQTLAVSRLENQDVTELPRIKRSGNHDWLQRAYADFALDDPEQWSFVLLSGGKDISAFRIRIAQSHLRGDMLPSFWSDCALLDVVDGKIEQATLYSLPILQPATEAYAPTRNGLVVYPLAKFPTQTNAPNLALLAIPVARAEIGKAVEMYKKARVAYDAVENILPWLAFVWGAGKASNPLLQQVGFPAAVMLNQIFAAQGFDLAPGVNSQGSTPESFWSGVKHWQDFYSKTQTNGLLPKARYVIDHSYDIDEL